MVNSQCNIKIKMFLKVCTGSEKILLRFVKQNSRRKSSKSNNIYPCIMHVCVWYKHLEYEYEQCRASIGKTNYMTVILSFTLVNGLRSEEQRATTSPNKARLHFILRK